MTKTDKKITKTILDFNKHDIENILKDSIANGTNIKIPDTYHLQIHKNGSYRFTFETENCEIGHE